MSYPNPENFDGKSIEELFAEYQKYKAEKVTLSPLERSYPSHQKWILEYFAHEFARAIIIYNRKSEE